MKEVKLFPYVDEPKTAEPPFINKSVDMQKVHEQCMQELALQQSKRDQLIAFYLTITGLVSAYLFSSDVTLTIRIFILAALFIIGCIWSAIAIRYKTYKDSYWMACKTISSLFSENLEQIDKPRLQHTFYCVLKKCYKGVPKDKNGKPQLLKYAKKNLTSAEFLMFFTLALLSAMSGAAGLLVIFLALGLGWISYVIVAVFFIGFLVYQALKYNKAALSIFKVLQDNSDAAFNKAFEKAWLLHFFS